MPIQFTLNHDTHTYEYYSGRKKYWINSTSNGMYELMVIDDISWHKEFRIDRDTDAGKKFIESLHKYADDFYNHFRGCIYSMKNRIVELNGWGQCMMRRPSKIVGIPFYDRDKFMAYAEEYISMHSDAQMDLFSEI